MVYPDEPDTYEPAPSGSRQHPVGKFKPKSIKYLECIEKAEKMLLRANDLSEDEVQAFADEVPDEVLGDRLGNSDVTNRPEVLEEIIKEYGNLLLMDDRFKQFVKKLTEAYKGKITIKK